MIDPYMIIFKEPSKEKALLILHVMTEMHLYFGKTKKISCMVMSKCICSADLFVGQHLIFIRFGTKLYRQVVVKELGF